MIFSYSGRLSSNRWNSAFRSSRNKLLRIVLLLAEGLGERRNSSNDARDHQNEGNE